MRHFLKRSAQLFAFLLAALFVCGLVRPFSIYHGWSPPGLDAAVFYVMFGALPALVLAPIIVGVIAYARGGQRGGG